VENQGKLRIPLDDQEVKQLLMRPNSYMNQYTFDQYSESLVQLWGNSVSIIRRDFRQRISEMIPVHTQYVTPVMLDGKPMDKVDDQLTGIKGTFFPEEVVHFRNMTSDGIWGKDPISLARESIGLGLAAEVFGSKFFKRGGNLKGVLETANHLEDETFNKFKNRWDKFYAGDAGDFSVPILEYGMTCKALGIPPEAAQFIATRQFQLQDIARWYNVPPHLLADLSRATFGNIEHSDLQFVKYTMRSILKSRETELETKLLDPKDYGKIHIRYNIEGLLRGDLATLTAHLKDMVTVGVLTRNEARGRLNLNPLDGLDTPLEPANITGNNNESKNSDEKSETL
ncbi:phage portal protein, partial [bacterium]|nr:phage portal protein [bacterium]